MKKRLIIVLVLAMIMMTFTACGNSGDSGSSQDSGSESSPEYSGGGQVASAEITDALKTMADIQALEGEYDQTAYSERQFIYGFIIGEDYYRAVTNLTPEMSKALWDLDLDDPDYEAKFTELLSQIEIEDLEYLNDQILTQEEMDALVGKTGQDLLDDGWRSGMGYNLDNMEVFLDYGPFEYTVVFDGEIPESKMENFNEEEDIKDLTVKSVEFLSFGNASYDME